MPPVCGVAGNMAHARCQHHSTYQQDKNVPGDRTRFRTGKHSSSVVCSVFFYHESILNFVKALSESNNLVGFVFYSVIVVDHID